MSKAAKHLYEFGPFRLDAAEHVLLRDGEPVSLTPKAFDTLLVLVQNRGHILGKDELMKTVWPDTVVEENNLNQNISTLRRALGETGEEQKYIETIPKRGYRFVASVKEFPHSAADLVVERHTRTHLLIEEEDGASTRSTLAPLIRGKVSLRLALTALIALIAASLGLNRFIHQKRSLASFQAMRIIKLTSTGKAATAAISPDGRYIVHVNGPAQPSLWIKQVSTGSAVQILPPAEGQYRGITFSRDGSYIYYVRAEKANISVGNLYQMPVLGGPSKKLIEDVDSPITLSPDGKRLAFIRNFSNGENALMIANADGTGDHRLATAKSPNYFGFGAAAGPAWSPDGSVIACAVARSDAGGSSMNVTQVAVEGGVEKAISNQRWESVGQLAWFSDGAGLVMIAADDVSRLAQIWQVSYPAGEVRRITNDLNSYSGISLTTDSSTAVTVAGDSLSTIWEVPDGDASRAAQITSGGGEKDGRAGLSWTPDGKIVYTSSASGNQDIWIMDPDGGNKKQLTANSRDNVQPTVSSDGRYVVFVSTRDGRRNIWRMDIDGGNVKQLTKGNSEGQPRCSPNGKSVVYMSDSSGVVTLWKMSIDGTNPLQLTGTLSIRPVISPDGRLIVYSHWDEKSNPPWRTAIVPIEGGSPKMLTFSIPIRQTVQWSSDGNALIYSDTRGGISNLWSQPLAGGPPTPLSGFKSDQIFAFDWSPDGKQLAVARGTVTSDVVLISNFK